MGSATPHPMPRHRTAAVTILAILAVIAGVIAVVDTLRYLGLLPIAEVLGMHFFGVDWLGAILSAVLALIWFAVARQIWNLDPRGWLFVILMAAFNLIILALAIIGATTFQAVAVNVIVNAVALILALLPSTKQAFGAA
jgi:hypothetical protein